MLFLIFFLHWQVKHQLTIDPIYLAHLGLNSQTQSNEGVEPSKSEYTLVVGSSVEPEKFQDAVEFMESVRKNMAGYRLVMYDLGLSQQEGALVSIQLFNQMLKWEQVFKKSLGWPGLYFGVKK